MILKPYQEDALDCLAVFFKHCKTSSNPRFAYEETTKDWPVIRAKLGKAPEAQFKINN